jgi:hypothetical protein
MSDFTKRSREWDRDNIAAAAIILASIDKFGGPDSLAAIWARMVLPKLAAVPKSVESAAKPSQMALALEDAA